MARNSSKKSSGMNTQRPAIVRGSDQRTRIIVSSSLAAALSASSLFLAVVSPSGARAFAVQLYLLAYDVGRVSGSGTVGSRSAVGSGAARSTTDDRREIDVGGVGVSVADLSISKRTNAQRMASTAAACSPWQLQWSLKVAHSSINRWERPRRQFYALIMSFIGSIAAPAARARGRPDARRPRIGPRLASAPAPSKGGG